MCAYVSMCRWHECVCTCVCIRLHECAGGMNVCVDVCVCVYVRMCMHELHMYTCACMCLYNLLYTVFLCMCLSVVSLACSYILL